MTGWEIVGKPGIDRTGKYSASGRTGCAVTAKDFLLSAPIPVQSGQCYRLVFSKGQTPPSRGGCFCSWTGKTKINRTFISCYLSGCRTFCAALAAVNTIVTAPLGANMQWPVLAQPTEKSGWTIILSRRSRKTANRCSLLLPIRSRPLPSNLVALRSHGTPVAAPKVV